MEKEERQTRIIEKEKIERTKREVASKKGAGT